MGVHPIEGRRANVGPIVHVERTMLGALPLVLAKGTAHIWMNVMIVVCRLKVY